MKQLKERTAVWLYPDTIKRMDESLDKANARSRSELMEQALTFYLSYLDTKDATPFLAQAIISSVEATLQSAEQRTATNLFRLAVEIDMMMHLLAASLDITDDELRALRGRCVGEVKKTKGKLTFDAAVAFQQRDD